MKKEITRKEFLRKTACLAACPFFFSAIVSSCGKTGDGDDSGNNIGGGGDGPTLTPGGEGNLQRIELSSYDGMSINSGRAITLPDSQKILLLKKSDSEYQAFDTKCPHEGHPVNLANGDNTLGQCSFHGAVFNESGAGISGPAEEFGLSLTYFKVTNNSDHLIVDVKNIS